MPGWAATTPPCSPPGPWQRATAVPRVYEGKFCFFQPAQLPDPPRRGSGRWHLEGMVALGTRGDTARPQHPRMCRGCMQGRELTEARNHHEELSAPPGHPGYAKGGKRKQTKENEATSCHLSPPSLPRQLRGAAGCVNTRRNPAPPLAWSCGRFQGLPKPSSKPREPGGCSRDAHLLAMLSLSPRPLGCAAAVLRSKPLALLWVFLRQRGTEIRSCGAPQNLTTKPQLRVTPANTAGTALVALLATCPQLCPPLTLGKDPETQQTVRRYTIYSPSPARHG